jgi:hypothetical protein
LSQNKDKWANCLLSSKKVQQTFCRFADEIAAILDDELADNSKLTYDYLRLPLEQTEIPK